MFLIFVAKSGKDDIRPEARTKAVSKKTWSCFSDHGWTSDSAQKERMTLDGLPVNYLPIEKDDKGVDVLDLLLQLLHQLRHRLAVALHVVSQAWLCQFCLLTCLSQVSW